MSEDDRVAAAASRREVSFSSLPPLQSHASTDFRILELEIENSRLHRLVAELLLKNQQLRKAEE
jgi:hypothetical protein